MLKKQYTVNQFESPPMPTKWTGDERRFYVRLVEILERLYNATIGPNKIRRGAITEEKLAAGAVTGYALCEGAVDTAHIKNAAITSAKIGTAEIKTANIEDAAITSAKIGNAAVTTAKIGEAAIQSANIDVAEIKTASVMHGFVTTALIDTGAVGTAQIADGSITDAKIVELTASKITAGVINVNRLLLSGTVYDEHGLPTIKSLIYYINHQGELESTSYTDKYETLDGEMLTDGSVDSTQLADLAVTTGKLANDAVTADKLVAGAVTAGKIAANAVTANEIAANAVTADKIDANAVTAVKIAADAIQTSHISSEVGRELNLSSNTSINTIVATQTGALNTAMDELRGDIEAGTVSREDYEAFLSDYATAYAAVRQAADSLEIAVGEMNSFVSQMETYFRFTQAGLEIGKTDSSYTSLFSNSAWSILQDGFEVLRISEFATRMSRLHVEELITMGSTPANFAIVNGGLAIYMG